MGDTRIMHDFNIADAFEIIFEIQQYITNSDTIPACRSRQVILGHLDELLLQFEHHALGKKCPSINIDHLESRPPNYGLVAIVENKNAQSKNKLSYPTKFEFALQMNLAQRTELSYYVVNSLQLVGLKLVLRFYPRPCISTILSWEDYVNFQTNLPNDDIIGESGKSFLFGFSNNTMWVRHHKQIDTLLEEFINYIWKGGWVKEWYKNSKDKIELYIKQREEMERKK